MSDAVLGIRDITVKKKKKRKIFLSLGVYL